MALVTALVALQAPVTAPARAQLPTTTSPTTTTTAPTTTTGPPATSPPPAPTAPPPPSTAPPPQVVRLTPPPSTTSTTTARPPSIGAGAAKAYVDNLVRSGANSTSALVAALKTLETVGMPADEVMRVGYGRFPVGGLASFTDDFGDPRLTPVFHTHQGNDIFAAFDTPVRAPADGTLRLAEEAVGGKSAYVTTADGTFYYMTHLKAFAPDARSGARVAQGQVVATVGDSGNARGGAPHVHFEIRPQGGAAVNPKPFLDRWIAEALAAVPAMIAGLVENQPAVLQATGLTRRFDVGGLDRRAQAPVDPLLWASSVNPTGSALRLAEMQVARVAEGIDWEERAARAQAEEANRRASGRVARAVLGPLTPAPLGHLIGGPAGS